jgi:hypothetical protein
LQGGPVAKPDAARFVGLALDAANGRGGSDDLISLEVTDLTTQKRRDAARMGYFIEGRAELNHVSKDEYPEL